MSRFMLDTGTCSYIMKRSNPVVLNRLQATPIDEVCMSVVTKSELLYGVEVSPRRAQDATALSSPTFRRSTSTTMQRSTMRRFEPI